MRKKNTPPDTPVQYSEFLFKKTQSGNGHGFNPISLPDSLFDFQRDLVEWSLRRGRAALFADCGLGKSLCELVWADNVVRHTNRPVLLLTALAVANQMVREGEKFGIECVRSKDGERQPPSSLHKFRGFVGDQKKNQFSQYIWRQYASSVWDDIRIDRVLPHRQALKNLESVVEDRESSDESPDLFANVD